MNKNFIYSMVALLALANGIIYIQKTNSSFFSIFLPHSEKKSDSWINEDPGWRNNQDFSEENQPPKVDSVLPKIDSVPPRTQPKTEPQPQPQPQDPQRPFRRNIDPG